MCPTPTPLEHPVPSFEGAAARWAGACRAVERVINLSKQELVQELTALRKSFTAAGEEPVSPLPADAAAPSRASAILSLCCCYTAVLQGGGYDTFFLFFCSSPAGNVR